VLTSCGYATGAKNKSLARIEQVVPISVALDEGSVEVVARSARSAIIVFHPDAFQRRACGIRDQVSKGDRTADGHGRPRWSIVVSPIGELNQADPNRGDGGNAQDDIIPIAALVTDLQGGIPKGEGSAFRQGAKGPDHRIGPIIIDNRYQVAGLRSGKK
jgi:hypothetical protein